MGMINGPFSWLALLYNNVMYLCHVSCYALMTVFNIFVFLRLILLVRILGNCQEL